VIHPRGPIATSPVQVEGWRKRSECGLKFGVPHGVVTCSCIEHRIIQIDFKINANTSKALTNSKLPGTLGSFPTMFFTRRQT
jgi:hypothetical protein